jgi:transcriptional regulator with XRE-family HTH domain
MDLAPMLTPVQHLGEYIREQRTAAQISLRSLAAKAGVSNPYLSQVERGLRKPSAGVLAQIAQGLQISTESLLIKAGILSAAGAGAVVDAIRADTHLTDRHKSVLIEIYSAFRQESDAEEAESDRPAVAAPEDPAPADHRARVRPAGSVGAGGIEQSDQADQAAGRPSSRRRTAQ